MICNQLCCVPTTNGRPVTRTVARFVQAPAQDPLVCSSTRQCWLQLLVSCTVVRRCCDCTTSSAPTTNLQTRLDSTNTSLTVRLSFSQRLWVNPGLAKSVRPWLLRSPAERFGLRILFFFAEAGGLSPKSIQCLPRRAVAEIRTVFCQLSIAVTGGARGFRLTIPAPRLKLSLSTNPSHRSLLFSSSGLTLRTPLAVHRYF